MEKVKLEELKNLIEEVRYVSMQEVNVKDKFINSIPYDVTLRNGMIIRREKLTKGGTDGSAAVILPIKYNGNILLTVEPRVFTASGVGVGLPAGYINPGETPVHAALRELKEETGCVCESTIDLGGFYQDMGCSGAYNRLFLGLDAKKVCEPHFDEGEVVKTFECSYSDALELIDLGYIEGCNALITISKAKKDISRIRRK